MKFLIMSPAFAMESFRGCKKNEMKLLAGKYLLKSSHNVSKILVEMESLIMIWKKFHK